MTPKLPGLLVRYLKQSRCVVFVGAGLSVGAGLPLWTRLLEEVIDHLVSSMPDGDTHQPELRKLVSQGKLLEVADFCKEQLGAAYHQYLTDRLRGDKGTVPQTHKALMHLPFSAWVTTNYDKLLERAYSEVKQGFPKMLTHKDTDMLGRLLFDSGPFILKAHGDIDRPETVVLTSRDYSEIIHANPAFNEIFSGLLLTKALLFVGYSLSDPDFRLLMDRQLTHFRGFVPERFALMTGLGRVERDVLWRTARIQVIPYENASGRHEEVLHFLEALQAAVQPPPAATAPPPQAQTGSYNMPSPSPVPVSAATSVPRAGPSTPAHAPAPARIQQEASQPIAFGLPSDEGSPAPSGPPQSAAMPRQAAVLPQRLFIETVEGRLQLRLTDEQSTPLAQGLVPEALNARVFQALARERQGAQSHAHLYKELRQLFSQHLPAEVLKVLGAPGAARQAPLVLRTTAELAHFPWELLPVGAEPLSLVRKVVRAPVGVSSQARGTPAVREAPRILLVEGPRNRGGGAARELERLVTVYQAMPEASCTVLSGAEATFGNVMKQLDEALPDLLYFTGDVGQADGELFLDLAGEVELSLGALRSVLNRGQLPFLVMNAPSAAFAPFDGRPGFMELATQAGVGAFVGAFDMPGSEVSCAFMFALHHALVLRMPVAEAFRHALREAHARFPDEPTVFSHVLSGDGGLWLHKPG